MFLEWGRELAVTVRDSNQRVEHYCSERRQHQPTCCFWQIFGRVVFGLENLFGIRQKLRRVEKHRINNRRCVRDTLRRDSTIVSHVHFCYYGTTSTTRPIHHTGSQAFGERVNRRSLRSLRTRRASPASQTYRREFAVHPVHGFSAQGNAEDIAVKLATFSRVTDDRTETCDEKNLQVCVVRHWRLLFVEWRTCVELHHVIEILRSILSLATWRLTGNPEVIDAQFLVWRPTTWRRAVNGTVGAIGIFASFPIRMRMNHMPELASSTPCKCVNKSCNVEQRGRRDPDQRILKPEDSG